MDPPKSGKVALFPVFWRQFLGLGGVHFGGSQTSNWWCPDSMACVMSTYYCTPWYPNFMTRNLPTYSCIPLHACIVAGAPEEAFEQGFAHDGLEGDSWWVPGPRSGPSLQASPSNWSSCCRPWVAGCCGGPNSVLLKCKMLKDHTHTHSHIYIYIHTHLCYIQRCIHCPVMSCICHKYTL